jgi:hypothetical protein
LLENGRNNSSGGSVDSIECGSASGTLQVDNDGIGTAHFSGLMVPANFLAMGGLTMRAGSQRGAKGLLYRNDLAAICCDPASMTASYPNMAPSLRGLPVAFVVNEAQTELYLRVVQRAAASGLVRKMFHGEAEAREWLSRTVQAMSDNRRWWQGRVPRR